jgi:hypothetical protein
MLTVNKHIIHEDHFMMQHCFDAFWVKGYLTGSKGTLVSEQFSFLCREDGRLQSFQYFPPQLLMQLGIPVVSRTVFVRISDYTSIIAL